MQVDLNLPAPINEDREMKRILIEFLVTTVILAVVIVIIAAIDIRRSEQFRAHHYNLIRSELQEQIDTEGMTEEEKALYYEERDRQRAEAADEDDGLNFLQRINEAGKQNRVLGITLFALIVVVACAAGYGVLRYSVFLQFKYNFKMFGIVGKGVVFFAAGYMVVRFLGEMFGVVDEVSAGDLVGNMLLFALPGWIILAIMALIKTKSLYHFYLVPATVMAVASVGGLLGRVFLMIFLAIFALSTGVPQKGKCPKCGAVGIAGQPCCSRD